MSSPLGEPLSGERASEVYLQYGERLTAFAWGLLRDRELARDVVQITFDRALSQAGSVPERALKSWLYRVAYHEALLIRRRRGVEINALESLRQSAAVDDATGESLLLRREQVQQVKRALEALPLEQRTVVRMRVYDGLKFAEIAGLLEVPLGTVLTRMRLAMQKLRRALSDCHE